MPRYCTRFKVLNFFEISLKSLREKKPFYFFSGENKIKQEIANINFLLYTWIYKKGGVGVVRI